MALTFWTFVAAVTLAPLLAGLAPLAGRQLAERWLHSLLGLAAGLMLGVTFLQILPRTFELGGHSVAPTLGFTFVALYLLEGTMSIHGHSPHEHPHGHEEGDHFDTNLETPIVALLALGIHMFLDGLVLAPAFELGQAVGLSAALAVLVHKLPGGFATGTILAATGHRDRKGALGVAAVAGMTAVGAIVGLTLVDVSGLVPHLLAVAAATLLFVAVAELLPELHHGPHKGRVTLGLIVGVLLIAGVTEVLEMAGLVHAH